MPSDEARTQLREAVASGVPEAPGVYTWLGGEGEPLYVGKAVNLRRRMLSYLAPSQLDPRSRMHHLCASIRGFRYREAPGELAALLLEDGLIKQLRPRHNTRQRDYLERRYLLLTDDQFPTCLIVEDRLPRPGRLFGPFKDQYFVAGLIEILTDEFGLRACPDRQPLRRSARFDLGVCSGPCRSAIAAPDYSRIAGRVESFLLGDGTWIAAHLQSAMKQAADDLRFERAAEARERLAFCRRFATRQAFIRAFREGEVLTEEPRFRLTYRFDRGGLAALCDHAGNQVPVPPALADPPRDPRFALDRANLVYSWLQKTARPTDPDSAPC